MILFLLLKPTLTVPGGGAKEPSRFTRDDTHATRRFKFTRFFGGAHFIEENGGGPGVRLRKGQRTKPSNSLA